MSRAVAENSPFARQMLVPGWDQQRVTGARVLIAGVGALGNACGVDLALTGVGRLVLADFDVVETSNLSRTILFRRGDEGRRKVAVAAERLRELMLAPDPVLVALDTDVVSDLGWGVYRRVDLILGCVDSSEARAAVGMPARALGVPAVFGGLYGHDGSVTVQGVGGGPCVACAFSTEEWREWSRRYSCAGMRQAMVAEARIPATQVTASLVGALMVQEALALLQGDRERLGSRLFLAGRRPIVERVGLRQNPRCPFHAEIEQVEEDGALSTHMTAGEMLARLVPWGDPVTVRLAREFLLGCECAGCGTPLRLWKSKHRTRTNDLMCQDCQAQNRPFARDPAITSVSTLSPASDRAILDCSLDVLGVPPLHLLEVSGTRRGGWVELTGDLPTLLPGWPGTAEAAIR